MGGKVLRPLVRLRLETAPRDAQQTCLIDIGSPDTVIAWPEAKRAGIDPNEGDLVELPDGYAVGGAPVTEARGFVRSCLIEDSRYFIHLPAIPILFINLGSIPGSRPSLALVP